MKVKHFSKASLSKKLFISLVGGLLLNTACNMKVYLPVYIDSFRSEHTFKPTSSKVPDKLKESLDPYVRYLHNHKDCKVSIELHTEWKKGKNKQQYALCKKRAVELKKYLLSQNIKPNQILTIPKGQKHNVGVRSHPVSNERNNRLDVKIIHAPDCSTPKAIENSYE